MKIIKTANYLKIAKNKKEWDPNPWAVCVVPDTLITIEDGSSKKIKNINIGDNVITHKGRSKKVTNIFSRFIDEDIYKIKTSGIPDYLYVTKEHPIFALPSVQKFSGYAKDFNGKKTGKKWYKYNFLEEPLFINAENINKNYAIHSPSISFSNDKIDNLSWEDAFLLGIYCAEGSIGGTLNPTKEWRTGKNHKCHRKWEQTDKGCYTIFTLHKDKDSILKEFLKKYCIKKLDINKFKIRGPYKNNPNVINVSINSRELSKLCIKHIGQGSSKKKLSKSLMASSPNILMYFMMGYFMGDGSFDISTINIKNNIYSSFNNKKLGKVTATSASKNLIHQLFWLCDKCGVISNLYRPKQNGGPHNRNKTYKGYGICLNSTGLSKFSQIINDLNVFEQNVEINTSGRKGQRFARAACTYGKIISINKIPYKGLVYNLEVKDDNSYLANLCSVHNCHTTGGKKKDPKKFENCVLDVKKEQKSAQYEGQPYTPEIEDEFADKAQKRYKRKRELGNIPDKSERQRGSRVSPKEISRGLESTPAEMDDLSWKRFVKRKLKEPELAKNTKEIKEAEGK